MNNIGKTVFLLGLFIAAAGLALWLLGDKLRFLGRLPGDIRIERENVKIYVPIMTMLLLSVLLSLISWVVRRFL